MVHWSFSAIPCKMEFKCDVGAATVVMSLMLCSARSGLPHWKLCGEPIEIPGNIWLQQLPEHCWLKACPTKAYGRISLMKCGPWYTNMVQKPGFSLSNSDFVGFSSRNFHVSFYRSTFLHVYLEIISTHLSYFNQRPSGCSHNSHDIRRSSWFMAAFQDLILVCLELPFGIGVEYV